MGVLKTSVKERNRLEVFARVKRGEHLDGSIHLWFRGREPTFTELTQRPSKPKAQRPPKAGGTPHKPAADHPWKRRTATPKQD